MADTMQSNMSEIVSFGDQKQDLEHISKKTSQKLLRRFSEIVKSSLIEFHICIISISENLTPKLLRNFSETSQISRVHFVH